MSACHTRGQVRVRWMPRPDGLEESVQFRPGFNCPRTDMQGHGAHGMEIAWLLKGPDIAVQLIFATDWVPGELWPGHGISPDGTRGWKASSGGWSTDPRGYGIGDHTRWPQYDGHEPQGKCGLLGGTCWYDESPSAADSLAPRFMADGEGVIWDELEKRYRALQDAYRGKS